jgi:dipeptidyl aminopeptidase/acylaminoacyl peptidase
MLERTVVKRRYDEAPEVFEQASPLSHVHADAPPALIIHGDLDTLAPVAEARAFAEQLREKGRNPVVYVELRGAHHAFEILQSIRALHTIAAVDLFLTWLLTVDPPRALVALDDASASDAAGAAGATGPTSRVHTAQ